MSWCVFRTPRATLGPRLVIKDGLTKHEAMRDRDARVRDDVANRYHFWCTSSALFKDQLYEQGEDRDE